MALKLKANAKHDLRQEPELADTGGHPMLSKGIRDICVIAVLFKRRMNMLP